MCNRDHNRCATGITTDVIQRSHDPDPIIQIQLPRQQQLGQAKKPPPMLLLLPVPLLLKLCLTLPAVPVKA